MKKKLTGQSWVYIANINMCPVASIYNPKYEVKLSQSTNTMFPNYEAPDSIISVAETPAENGQKKRRHSINSVKTRDVADGRGDKKSVALRDFFASMHLPANNL